MTRVIDPPVGRSGTSSSALTTADVPRLVERVVREIDRRVQAQLERRGRL